MTAIATYAARTFFDRQKIDQRLTKARRKALIRTGALVRKIAQRSIKKPRKGWTPATRKAYEAERKRRKAALAKGHYLAPDARDFKRPLPSNPGAPPRDKTGLLKRTIFFGYDAARASVVVGPIKLRSGTVKLLEHGGEATLPGYRRRSMRMKFKARPFMRPARTKAARQVHKFFKNIL